MQKVLSNAAVLAVYGCVYECVCVARKRVCITTVEALTQLQQKALFQLGLIAF